MTSHIMATYVRLNDIIKVETRVFSAESAQMDAVHVFLTKYVRWTLKKTAALQNGCNVSETHIKCIIKNI
jgi:hypothetical protein